MATTYGNTSVPMQLRFIRAGMRTMNAISPSFTGYIALEMFCTPLRRNKPDFKSEITAPATPVEIPFNGGYLRGNEWGTGPTVLLVHGWESNASRFRKNVQPLVDAGFRVVAVDGPAHGDSDGRQTNYLDYGHAIHTMVEHVGGAHAVIAHSIGAASTISMLERFPDVAVSNVVLIGSPDCMDDIVYSFSRIVGLPESGLTSMKRQLVYRTGIPLERFNMHEVVKPFTQRALVIHDEDDNITPVSGGRAIAANWPNATYVETQGLGHRRIVSDQKVLQEMIAFLQDR
ncbi:MAG: alpha/beta hydrolase [Chloroflexota bacterium]